MEWFLGLPTEWQAMLVLTWGIPYVGLAIGLLVPYRQVKLWMTLYFESEATRKESVEVMKRSADAIQVASTAINAAFGPLTEEAKREPTQ